MSDLDMVKICASAMGLVVGEYSPGLIRRIDKIGAANDVIWGDFYWPLTHDAQAMALVKKFKLQFGWYDKDGDGVAGDWCAAFYADGHKISSAYAQADEANRAIVECVAKIQGAKP